MTTTDIKNFSVSVVIPTYNCASLLPDAIKSAYGQKGSFIKEVIVVDDGSPDDTENVIRKMSKDLPENFIYHRKKNGGEASARNRGVELATGEFIAFLDQDDIWLDNKLEEQMALFSADDSLSLTFTAYTRISGDEREFVGVSDWDESPEAILKRLMVGCCITPSTVVAKRDALVSVGLFDESLKLGCDWNMWLRLAASGARMGYLNKPLTEYLWHATNMSRDSRKIAQAAEIIFPKLFSAGKLPASVQKLESECYARWSLNGACFSLALGDNKEARRYLYKAFKARPGSVRPGWLKIFAQSLFSKKQDES